MIASLNGAERETIVNASDEDELVRIWTAQRRFITKMRRNKSFTEVANGFFGSSEWAEFTVPADRWSPLGVKRSQNLTTEQRNAAAERLRRARGKE